MPALTLIPAPGESPPTGEQFEQIKVATKAFEMFTEAVCASLRASYQSEADAGVDRAPLGQPNWIYAQNRKLSAILGPSLETVAGPWLRDRIGRRVRLQIDEAEAEAQTLDRLFSILLRC